MRLIILVVFLLAAASAQQYDIVLRGGHVIDPGNGINARMDVAITGDQIAAVAANIPAASARRVVDASASMSCRAWSICTCMCSGTRHR